MLHPVNTPLFSVKIRLLLTFLCLFQRNMPENTWERLILKEQFQLKIPKKDKNCYRFLPEISFSDKILPK